MIGCPLDPKARSLAPSSQRKRECSNVPAAASASIGLYTSIGFTPATVVPLQLQAGAIDLDHLPLKLGDRLQRS
jgi:hypothetical protein